MIGDQGFWQEFLFRFAFPFRISRCTVEQNELKKNSITDSGGSFIGALVGMAGVLDLLTRWEISADQAASFLGFAFMAAAAIRAWANRQSFILAIMRALRVWITRQGSLTAPPPVQDAPTPDPDGSSSAVRDDRGK